MSTRDRSHGFFSIVCLGIQCWTKHGFPHILEEERYPSSFLVKPDLKTAFIDGIRRDTGRTDSDRTGRDLKIKAGRQRQEDMENTERNAE